jgi:hypothetical protein
MRHVTVNYVAPGPAATAEERLLRSTCLPENADNLRRRGLAAGAGLDVVLLGATAALSPALRETLGAAGGLHEATGVYEGLLKRFPGIAAAFGGPYATHVFGFLRWLVIDALFPGEQVLCYDGDILHNVPLERLGAALAGTTRTATSTAFAAIADPQWFRVWERGLVELEGAPEGFFAPARAGLEAVGCDYRWSPEEYFAKVLIERGALPQDPLPESCRFWIVPQPHLLPRLYNFVRIPGGPESIPTPMRYERIGGEDTINGRPVAFWHLQKPFLSQLGACSYLRRRPALWSGRVYPFSFYGSVPAAADVRRIDPYHDAGGFPLGGWWQARRARALLEAERRAWEEFGSGPANPFAPSAVYRDYFLEGDLAQMFNARAWPRSGAWR